MKMTMMTSTTYDCPEPSLSDLSIFLSRYSSHLFGVGATCIRLEKNVERIAGAYGKEVELTIMTRHIHLSVWEKGKKEIYTTIVTVNHNAISFNTNTMLSKLSWEIADGKMDFDTAKSQFESIICMGQQNKWLVILLVACANAAFCRLFDGDMVAMLVVWIATLAGYFLKLQLLGKGVDMRVVAIVCSFASTVLGATCCLFKLGSTPEVALGTCVLYLVPGIPFLNSFSDLIYRHYMCSISRFMDAVVLTCCLSLGLCAAMHLMDVGMF